MENKCCCEYCKEQEIKRLKEDIKKNIKLLKDNLNIGFFDSLFESTELAEKRAERIYEDVKCLNKLNNEVND